MIAQGLTVDLEPTSIEEWYAEIAAISEGVIRANMLRPEFLHISPEIQYLPSCFVGRRWPIRTARAVHRQSAGNCLDIACLIAARSRVQGLQAGVRIQGNNAAGHALVVINGTTHEPKDFIT